MQKQRKYKKPGVASLSVVIPCYNSEKWIIPTLSYLWESIKQTKWKSIEIIIVDDGSTDNTSQKVKEFKKFAQLKVIRQKNAGRLIARRTGLLAASGDYVCFLDSRVYTAKNTFPYLVDKINEIEEAVVWNGHIEVERKKNPYARFWHVVAYLAWRKYFANPRFTNYNAKDFDYYPKGTTGFFAPREVLLKAYEEFNTDYSDSRNANDDTALIRSIANHMDIYLSPEYRFTYNARNTLKDFLKHTKHRGIVFIDGYMLPHTRYFIPLIAYLMVVPVFVLVAFFYPLVLITLPAFVVLAALIPLMAGAGLKDSLGFALILPVFVPAYTFGLYNGAYLKWTGKRRITAPKL